MRDLYDDDCFIDEVVDSGRYKGTKWYIKTLGSFPCAYVVCDFTKFDEVRLLDKYAHGGITFFGMIEFDDDGKIEKAIGWSYCICKDYIHQANRFEDVIRNKHIYFQKWAREENEKRKYCETHHKWTIEEIRKEIFYMIDKIEELKDKKGEING